MRENSLFNTIAPAYTTAGQVNFDIIRGLPYEYQPCEVVVSNGNLEKDSGFYIVNVMPTTMTTFVETNSSLEVGTLVYNNKENGVYNSPGFSLQSPGYLRVLPSPQTEWNSYNVLIGKFGKIQSISFCLDPIAGTDTADSTSYAFGLSANQHKNIPFSNWSTGSFGNAKAFVGSSIVLGIPDIDTAGKTWCLSADGPMLDLETFTGSYAVLGRGTTAPLMSGSSLSATFVFGGGSVGERSFYLFNKNAPQGSVITQLIMLTGTYYMDGVELPDDGIGTVSNNAVWEITAKQFSKYNVEVTYYRRDVPVGGTGNIANPRIQIYEGIVKDFSFAINGGDLSGQTYIGVNSLKVFADSSTPTPTITPTPTPTVTPTPQLVQANIYELVENIIGYEPGTDIELIN